MYGTICACLAYGTAGIIGRLLFLSSRFRGMALLLFGTLFLGAGPALAEDDNDLPSRLMNAGMMVAGGYACGASKEDASGAAGVIAVELAKLHPEMAKKIDKAYMEETIFELAGSVKADGNQGRPFDKPCSFWRQGLDFFLAKPEFVARILAGSPATAPAEPEDGQMSLAELRARLKSMSDSLPRGKLAAYVGCWKSPSGPSQVTLCFTGNGDTIDVELAGPQGVRCAYAAGEARPRGDGAYFYAFSSTGQCSNGQPTQHVEGYCDSVDGLNCLTSFFSEGNTMLGLKEDDTLEHYNTELAYQRVKR